MIQSHDIEMLMKGSVMVRADDADKLVLIIHHKDKILVAIR